VNFRNPYHFVPVAQGGNRRDLTVQTFRSLPQISHASYGAGLHSGTIRCRLRLATPIVVGAEQTRSDGEPARVEPFFLDGKPAIAGSTLRGLISSVAEAGSNSALRILDRKPYIRKRCRRRRVCSTRSPIRNSASLRTILRLRGPISTRSWDGSMAVLLWATQKRCRAQRLGRKLWFRSALLLRIIRGAASRRRRRRGIIATPAPLLHPFLLLGAHLVETLLLFFVQHALDLSVGTLPQGLHLAEPVFAGQ